VGEDCVRDPTSTRYEGLYKVSANLHMRLLRLKYGWRLWFQKFHFKLFD